MYARFNDGSVHYQDALGRTNPPHEFLSKDVDESKLGRNDRCGCGSGKKYKNCCAQIPLNLRTSWSERSVRERNLAFCSKIADVLELNEGKAWVDVRKDMTDERISEIYRFYGALWPRETDIYSLLPKVDAKFRALYTGIMDPRTIGAHALGLATHFDEFLIESPISNPNMLKPDFSPVESPESYRYQALKEFFFMMVLEPQIRSGLVNVFPDPLEFDLHLHREWLNLANARKAEAKHGRNIKIHLNLVMQDLLNSTNPLPFDAKVQMLIEQFGLAEKSAKSAIESFEVAAKEEPLTVLRPYEGAQITAFKMAPNFEMSLFVAQVTGSVLVTDSETKWLELAGAQHSDRGGVSYPWQGVLSPISAVPLDYQSAETGRKSTHQPFVAMRELLRSMDRLVRENNTRPKLMEKVRAKADNVTQLLLQTDIDTCRFQSISPAGGFYDTTVQRLLLRSSCNSYDKSVRAVYLAGDVI